MADKAKDEGTIKSGDAATYLVANAVGGTLVAAGVAFPPLGIAMLLGLGGFLAYNAAQPDTTGKETS